MLTSRNFWIGVVATVGALYVYNKYTARRAAS